MVCQLLDSQCAVESRHSLNFFESLNDWHRDGQLNKIPMNHPKSRKSNTWFCANQNYFSLNFIGDISLKFDKPKLMVE